MAKREPVQIIFPTTKTARESYGDSYEWEGIKPYPGTLHWCTSPVGHIFNKGTCVFCEYKEK